MKKNCCLGPRKFEKDEKHPQFQIPNDEPDFGIVLCSQVLNNANMDFKSTHKFLYLKILTDPIETLLYRTNE